MPVGTVEKFFAQVTNTRDITVNWSASAGSIDQSGNYVAPMSVPPGGTATITATLASVPSLSASAIVTVSSGPVTLTVSPPTATVKAGFVVNYVATVGGTSNLDVSWTVADLPGDNSFPGSVAGGEYTAPAPVMTSHTYAITATSAADPSKIASAMVTVNPLENQEQQAFPVKLGTSGGNANIQDCCSGTLGALLVDQKGKQYILSNNHVLGRLGHAAAGDAVVQPGYIDTFCDFSVPKKVAQFTIAPSILSTNVDAAIAEVVPGAVDSSGSIIGLGGINPDGSYLAAPPANTVATAAVGMSVAKSGRTTGLSCGEVEAVNGTILIDYTAICGNPSDSQILFRGQIGLLGFTKPGDSGSLIVDAATAEPLGLVMASSNDGTFSIANPVTEILNALNTATGTQLNFVGGAKHTVGCAAPPASSAQAPQSKNLSRESLPALSQDEVTRAVSIQSEFESQIMQNPAVLGVAVGRSQEDSTRAALLVFVERGRPSPRLPARLDGLPVRVLPTGRFGTGVLPRGQQQTCSSKPRSRAIEPSRQRDRFDLE